MKVGRFTVTKLNESVQSDISVKSKISIKEDEEIEVVLQATKEVEKKNLNEKNEKEANVVPIQKSDPMRNFSPQVNFMQYDGLIAAHQQFLRDYLEKDLKRQEKLQGVICEILELTEKNAKLEIENNQLRENIQKTNGKVNLSR